jgi:clathrin heavy chain
MYLAGEDFDRAVETMIEHGSDAWDHVQFRDALAKSAKPDLLYRSVDFYLSEQPKRVNELLQSLVTRYDHTAVVERARRRNVVALIKPYLVLVQKDNDIAAVNEALNELYVEEGDHESLRKSIESRSTFDQNALAKQLERHDTLEFRRIASSVYVKNKRYEEAIELSKKDELWADAMTAAAQSGNRELAEALLSFFVAKGLKACFVACLYSCYDLLRMDVVLELGWRNGLVELIVPFMVQSIREQNTRIDVLEEKERAREKAEKERAQKQQSASPFDQVAGAAGAAGPGGFGMLALPAPPVEPVMMPPGMIPVPPGMVPPGMVPVPPGMVMPPGMVVPGVASVPGFADPGASGLPQMYIGQPQPGAGGFMGIQ